MLLLEWLQAWEEGLRHISSSAFWSFCALQVGSWGIKDMRRPIQRVCNYGVCVNPYSYCDIFQQQKWALRQCFCLHGSSHSWQKASVGIVLLFADTHFWGQFCCQKQTVHHLCDSHWLCKHQQVLMLPPLWVKDSDWEWEQIFFSACKINQNWFSIRQYWIFFSWRRDETKFLFALRN